MCRRIPLLLALLLSFRSFADTIHLKTRDINTATEPDSAHTRPDRQWTADWRHLIAHFAAPVNQQDLLDLASRGILVTGGMDAQTIMLSVPATATLDGLGVAWSGDLQLADKLSPQLLRHLNTRPAYLIEFHSDVDPDIAAKIARASGLTIFPNPSLLRTQLLVLGSLDSLSAMAAWDEVAYVFPASDELLQGQAMLSCAGALSQAGTLNAYVKVGTGWAPDGPEGATIQYVFTTLTTKVDSYAVMSEIRRAMADWSRVARIRFVETTDPSASRTIAIEFGTAVNNDPIPFDGRSGVFAHTYYPAPPNSEPIAGDMHFDPSEDWHQGTNVDIYTVALHELGHAIGLGHSDSPGAVMYPYYHYGISLSNDDIAGAQALYGVPAGQLPSAPTPSPTQQPKPVAPLTLTVLSPSATFEATTASLAAAGQTTGAVGNVVVTWQTNTGKSGRANGGAYWTVPAIPLNTGDNFVTFNATDSSGNIAVAVVKITLGAGPTTLPIVTGKDTGKDLTPPTLSVDSPAPSTSQSSITLTGSAADNVGVVKVTWQTGSGASGIALGTTSWTASGIPVYPGNNTVIVRAYDAANNSRYVTLVVKKN